jgi:GH24 family phage-related lysozyme (muramidase)
MQYAAEFAERFPASALAIAAEGLVLTPTGDPNGRHVTIGAGYNLSTRTPQQVQADFQRAQIPAHRTQAILKGQTEMTPDEAVRLMQVSIKTEAEPIAQRAFEARHPGKWSTLRPEQRAALSYLAYSSGAGVQGYPKLMDAIARGDTDAAVKEYEINYKKDGKTHSAKRAVVLGREMLRGVGPFKTLINQGI